MHTFYYQEVKTITQATPGCGGRLDPGVRVIETRV